MTEHEQEQWKPIPDGPGYEVSWDCHFRVNERVSAAGRRLKAQPIATTTDDDGYVHVKYVNAEGKRVKHLASRVMLRAFAGECPPGQEARHWDDIPGNNRWRPGKTEEESRARGGNLFWGTPQQNRDDRRRNSPPAGPAAAKECVRCKEPFKGNGRRCHPCVVWTGREAAKMLRRRGAPRIEDVAKALDYPSVEGIHALAVRYGHYGQSWSQRVKAKARMPRKRRSRTATRSAPSPRAGGEGAPEGRKSVAALPSKPGQSRTIASPNVAERDNQQVARQAPKVTERSHFPYPADLVAKRDERTRRGTGRSR